MTEQSIGELLPCPSSADVAEEIRIRYGTGGEYYWIGLINLLTAWRMQIEHNLNARTPPTVSVPTDAEIDEAAYAVWESFGCPHTTGFQVGFKEGSRWRDAYQKTNPPVDVAALVEVLRKVKRDIHLCDWDCMNCGRTFDMSETDIAMYVDKELAAYDAQMKGGL